VRIQALVVHVVAIFQSLKTHAQIRCGSENASAELAASANTNDLAVEGNGSRVLASLTYCFTDYLLQRVL
jgi:hypothetical protein